MTETPASTAAADRGWLVLSPHLDDAVLSLGGTIGRLCRTGERVAVVTVFAGDEPLPAPSPFGAGMLRGWGFPPGRAMAGRRDEDVAACELLGTADPVHLPHLEAIHRCDRGTGTPLYPTVETLFGEPAAADEDLLGAIATALGALRDGARVAAPLAVGGHVDHRLVRAAAEAAFGPALHYYEEYPYARLGAAVVEPALGDLAAWRHTVVPLAAADVERKVAAIAAYRSQVPHLFGAARQLTSAATDQARRVGGERLWKKAPRS